MSSFHATDTEHLVGGTQQDLITSISRIPADKYSPTSSGASSSGSNDTWDSDGSYDSDDSSETDDPLSEFSSLLARINPESIISMALRIHREWSVSITAETSVTCIIQPPPLCGSYNLIHILSFSDGTKWVLRLPMERSDGSTICERRLKSEVMTMQFLRQNTTIPIPEIIKFDPTRENEIASPYTIMQFVEGTQVCNIWWDKSGPTPLEQRRRRILDTVAAAMSQLAQFKFDKIGTPEFLGERPGLASSPLPILGPLNLQHLVEIAQDTTESYTDNVSHNNGPFNSSKDYVSSLLNTQPIPEGEDVWYDIGIRKFVKLMIDKLPLSNFTAGKESFQLTHPDFGSQNFIVSEDGTLTGVIDWDKIQTQPEWIGSSCYPAWLTRDWDPQMYDYPGNDHENSPEELEEYRKYYAKSMASLGFAKYTSKAHIYEAVCNAAYDPDSIDGVVRKIFYYMFPLGEFGDGDLEDPDNLDLGTILKGLAENSLEQRLKERILHKIEELLSLPGASPADVLYPHLSMTSKLWHIAAKWAGVSFAISFFTRGGIFSLLKWPGIMKFVKGLNGRGGGSPL